MNQHEYCANQGGHRHHCCGNCGGGHCHSLTLSEREQAFLRCLGQIPYLPVARFLLRSIKSAHLESVALAPVYLLDAEDSMEHVKESGNLLLALEEKGLITLDYEEKLQGCDYETYYCSEVYHSFLDTVAEAKLHMDFLYDIGIMECGSMALTERGYAAVDALTREA